MKRPHPSSKRNKLSSTRGDIWKQQFAFGKSSLASVSKLKTHFLIINKLYADQPKIKIPSPPVYMSLPWKLKKKISDLPRPATKMAPALATMATASSNASDADLETRGCSKVSWKVHRCIPDMWDAICVNLAGDQPEKYNHNHSCKSNISMLHVLLNHDVLGYNASTHKIHACFFCIPKIKIKSQGKWWSQTEVVKNQLFPTNPIHPKRTHLNKQNGCLSKIDITTACSASPGSGLACQNLKFNSV